MPLLANFNENTEIPPVQKNRYFKTQAFFSYLQSNHVWAGFTAEETNQIFAQQENLPAVLIRTSGSVPNAITIDVKTASKLTADRMYFHVETKDTDILGVTLSTATWTTLNAFFQSFDLNCNSWSQLFNNKISFTFDDLKTAFNELDKGQIVPNFTLIQRPSINAKQTIAEDHLYLFFALLKAGWIEHELTIRYPEMAFDFFQTYGICTSTNSEMAIEPRLFFTVAELNSNGSPLTSSIYLANVQNILNAVYTMISHINPAYLADLESSDLTTLNLTEKGTHKLFSSNFFTNVQSKLQPFFSLGKDGQAVLQKLLLEVLSQGNTKASATVNKLPCTIEQLLSMIEIKGTTLGKDYHIYLNQEGNVKISGTFSGQNASFAFDCVIPFNLYFQRIKQHVPSEAISLPSAPPNDEAELRQLPSVNPEYSENMPTANQTKAHQPQIAPQLPFFTNSSPQSSTLLRTVLNDLKLQIEKVESKKGELSETLSRIRTVLLGVDFKNTDEAKVKDIVAKLSRVISERQAEFTHKFAMLKRILSTEQEARYNLTLDQVFLNLKTCVPDDITTVVQLQTSLSNWAKEVEKLQTQNDARSYKSIDFSKSQQE